MNHEPQSDEVFEQTLRNHLKPKPPNWESNRVILEALVLKDPDEKKKQGRKAALMYGWLASAGVIAAAFIAAFTIFQIDESAIDSQPESLAAPVQFGRQSVASAPTQANLRAVGAKQKLVDIEDMGWKSLEDGNVSRSYKYEYIDTVDLINEEDGSVMRVEVPRQEIVNVTYQLI